MVAMTEKTVTAFRLYDDDAGEAASAPLENQDVAHTFTITADQPFQLRFLLEETGGVDGSSMDDYAIEYAKNSGAFVALTTTDVGDGIRAVAAGLTNDAATTNRTTDGINDPGSGSFDAGEQSTDAIVDDMLLTAGNYTEHVYGIEIVDANVADTDFFEIRFSGSIVNLATDVRVTISKAGGGNAITGSIPIVGALVGAILGVGLLTTTISNAFTVTPNLTGVGRLESTITNVFTLSGTLAAGSANAITGSISSVFTVTGDIKGIGTLSSTIPAVLTVTPDLKGVGTLSSTISNVFTITADLKGVGVLSSTIPIVFTNTNDLKGIGVLSSTITGIFTNTNDLKGIGTLESTIPAIFTIGGVLGNANTQVTSSISAVFTVTGDIKGIGTLSSSISNAFTITTDLKGIGSLASTIPIVFTVTGAVTQAPVPITGSISIAFTLTGDVKGVGTLSSTIANVFTFTGNLSSIAQENVTSTIPIIFSITGTLFARKIFEWAEQCPDDSVWSIQSDDNSTWVEQTSTPIPLKRCA